MTASNRTTAIRIGSALLLVGGAAALFRGGPEGGVERSARADVRESKKPEAFQSGGARSEVVLREIAATLKQIDARLQRIERAAVEMADEQR